MWLFYHIAKLFTTQVLLILENRLAKDKQYKLDIVIFLSDYQRFVSTDNFSTNLVTPLGRQLRQKYVADNY